MLIGNLRDAPPTARITLPTRLCAANRGLLDDRTADPRAKRPTAAALIALTCPFDPENS